MGAEIYEDLCIACAVKGLRLELYASTKTLGENGHVWHELERLDVSSADGRRTLCSALIGPGPSGGIYAAAAVLLDRLTSAAT